MSAASHNAPAFSDSDGRELTDFARAVLEATFSGEDFPTLNPGLAATHCVGAFVSLKRGDKLRACLGSLNETELAPLGTLLEGAASRVATMDTRFPAIHVDELPQLSVEVSVMHDLRIVDGKGEARASGIEIGSHGVIIRHGKGRGLLLPQVAVERGWDVQTLLDQLCAKADLPKDFWKNPAATLKTFRGEIFEAGPVGGADLDPAALPASDRATLVKIVQSGFEKQSGEFSVSTALIQPQATRVGLLVECEDGRNALAIHRGASLIDLAKQATRSVIAENPNPAPLSRVILLTHPIGLSPEDEDRRFETVNKGAALASLKGRISFTLKSDTSSIETVLSNIGVKRKQWAKLGAEVTVFHAEEFRPVIPAAIPTATIEQGLIDEPTGSDREPVEKAAQAKTEAVARPRTTRQAAFAGKFYPATGDAIKAEVDDLFFSVPPDVALQDCRGIMLPHAGWEYCGDIVASTVSQAKIPERVVIICPKHTTLGANWSVSGDTEWKLPHATIPVDVEGVEFLAERVGDLEIETEAHREEHGIEVLLPFLRWANPRLKIVPIVIGDSEITALQPLADALAEWRAEMLEKEGRAPLLVISSDMNHFADDEENRRLDKLALQQLTTGDPNLLFQVCVENGISMCGLRPAVTILEALNSERQCEVDVTQYDTSARVSGDTSRVVGYAGALLK